MAVEQKDRVAQGRALWQLGSVLGDQGQFKNAEVPLRDALALLESELGSDHLDIAKACNGITSHVACTSSNMLFTSQLELASSSSAETCQQSDCHVYCMNGKATVNSVGISLLLRAAR